MVRDGTWNFCVGMLTLTRICIFGLPLLEFVVRFLRSSCRRKKRIALWNSEIQAYCYIPLTNTFLLNIMPYPVILYQLLFMFLYSIRV